MTEATARGAAVAMMVLRDMAVLLGGRTDAAGEGGTATSFR
jgi:hypothetical protein